MKHTVPAIRIQFKPQSTILLKLKKQYSALKICVISLTDFPTLLQKELLQN